MNYTETQGKRWKESIKEVEENELYRNSGKAMESSYKRTRLF